MSNSNRIWIKLPVTIERPGPRFNPDADEAGMVINTHDMVTVPAGTALYIEESEGRKLVRILDGEVLPPDRNYFADKHMVDTLP